MQISRSGLVKSDLNRQASIRIVSADADCIRSYINKVDFLKLVRRREHDTGGLILRHCDDRCIYSVIVEHAGISLTGLRLLCLGVGIFIFPVNRIIVIITTALLVKEDPCWLYKFLSGFRFVLVEGQACNFPDAVCVIGCTLQIIPFRIPCAYFWHLKLS